MVRDFLDHTTGNRDKRLLDYQGQKIRPLETMIAYCYEDLKKAISGRDRRT
jgi:hypothetical protein